MRPPFNVRVYGLLADASGRILVTDELRAGMKMTKFPGGGVEKGEGLGDALRREFREELSLEIENYKLFYINDFHQPSAFAPEDHLLSVYYTVSSSGWAQIETVDTAFDFRQLVEGAQCFRWVNQAEMDPAQFTFPVDKVVAELLRKGG